MLFNSTSNLTINFNRLETPNTIYDLNSKFLNKIKPSISVYIYLKNIER